tara:strand:- start:5346 stop:5765 length:420 start_codon:yes stop_codon:yes gene_type:complete
MARLGIFPRTTRSGTVILTHKIPATTLSATTAQQLGETDIGAGAHSIAVVISPVDASSGANTLVRVQGGYWKNGASAEAHKVWDAISGTIETITLGTETIVFIDEDIYGRYEWFRLDLVQASGSGTSTVNAEIVAIHKR